MTSVLQSSYARSLSQYSDEYIVIVIISTHSFRQTKGFTSS